jgi:hypothetical protein
VNRRPRFAIAASPAFIVAVLLLLANDHILKAVFPGLVTGKLSDLSGLFIVGTLVVALAPSRPGLVLAAVAAAFAVWKSPASQPLIDLWNTAGPLQIARVVDWTDLLVLPALLLALIYSRSEYRVVPARVVRPVMLGVTALAILATSKAPPKAIHQNGAETVVLFYQQARFATSSGTWPTMGRLEQEGFSVNSSWFFGTDDINSSVQCGVDDSPARAFVAAEARIARRGDHTEIAVRSLAFCRRVAPASSDEAIAAFEREVLAHLPDIRRVDAGRSSISPIRAR